MATLSFLLWAFLFTCVQTHSSQTVDATVTFQATPQHLSLGLGGTLSLRCEILQTDTTSWTNYDAILISRIVNDEFPQTVATISSIDKDRALCGAGVKAKIFGHLDKTEGGYLKVDIENYSLKDAGSYSCFVKGRDASFFEETSSKKIEITAEKPTIEKLLRYVFSLKNLLKDNKNNDIKFKKYLQDELNNNRQNIHKIGADIKKNYNLIFFGNFVESAPFNGRVYRLSLTQHQNVEQSQKVCETMGGYLAEPNDRAEFLFIQNFLKNVAYINTLPLVYIGLTDEEDEGKWVGLKNKNDPIFLNFAKGDGNGGRMENYMVLWTSEFLYGDIASYWKRQYKMRFLCEIPNV